MLRRSSRLEVEIWLRKTIYGERGGNGGSTICAALPTVVPVSAVLVFEQPNCILHQQSYVIGCSGW